MNIESAGGRTLQIVTESDIVIVRKAVRNFAGDIGFRVTDITRIVTAASELARNVYRYAGSGVVIISAVMEGPRKGMKVVFKDNGPGIKDIAQAMEMGTSSGNGLGLGLPGAKRLMDQLDIESEVGLGTKVVITKWLN